MQKQLIIAGVREICLYKKCNKRENAKDTTVEIVIKRENAVNCMCMMCNKRGQGNDKFVEVVKYRWTSNNTFV